MDSKIKHLLVVDVSPYFLPNSNNICNKMEVPKGDFRKTPKKVE